MTIANELAGYIKYKKLTGNFGVELETEVESPSDYPNGFLTDTGDNYFDTSLKFWKAVRDGSLRHFGVEYIFNKPFSFTDAIKAFEEFDSETHGIPFLTDSPSTSTHVHIDMSNEDFRTLGSFIALWFAFENILVAFSGPTRKTNLFAMPVALAEGNISHAKNMFSIIESASGNPFVFNENTNKYAALNLCPLRTQGSVEIRCFRGTVNVQALTTWLGILNSMLLYARTISPIDVLERLNSIREKPGFILDVFGAYAQPLFRHMTNPNFMIARNLCYVRDIALAVSDWDKINTAYSNKPKVEAKTDKAAKVAAYAAAYSAGLNVASSDDLVTQWVQLDTPAAPPPMPAYWIEEDHEEESNNASW